MLVICFPIGIKKKRAKAQRLFGGTNGVAALGARGAPQLSVRQCESGPVQTHDFRNLFTFTTSGFL